MSYVNKDSVFIEMTEDHYFRLCVKIGTHVLHSEKLNADTAIRLKELFLDSL